MGTVLKNKHMQRLSYAHGGKQNYTGYMKTHERLLKTESRHASWIKLMDNFDGDLSIDP